MKLLFEGQSEDVVLINIAEEGFGSTSIKRTPLLLVMYEFFQCLHL